MIVLFLCRNIKFGVFLCRSIQNYGVLCRNIGQVQYGCNVNWTKKLKCSLKPWKIRQNNVFYDTMQICRVSYSIVHEKAPFLEGLAEKCLEGQMPRRINNASEDKCLYWHLSFETFVLRGICPSWHLSVEAFVLRGICPSRLLSFEAFVRPGICPSRHLSSWHLSFETFVILTFVLRDI